jgi:hypothetical protein
MSIIAKGKPLLEEMRALLRRQGYAYGAGCTASVLLNTIRIRGSLRERAALTPSSGCFKTLVYKNTKAFRA